MATYRIAIDGNEANVVDRVGSNTYAYELLVALEQQLAKQANWQITVLLTQHPCSDMPLERPGWKYVVVRPKQFWTQWALPRFLYQHRSNFDLFFTPGHYAPRHAPLPYISAVLDLAFLSHPDSFTLRDRLQLSYWTKYSVKNAKKIITISHASKTEIAATYKIPPENIAVCYPAIGIIQKPTLQEAAKDLKKFAITKPFFISLGTIQPRKNLIKLIEAFESYSRKQQGLAKQTKAKQHNLVLAGKEGWLAAPILKRIAASPFKELIIVTGFITTKEKWSLLRSATAVVIVGLKEGFGIPALEALEANTIPVVANAASLPEVVGESGILVDPHNTLDIADGLWKAATLKAREKAVLKKKGREQKTLFSWKNTAQHVQDLWQNVLTKKQV